MLAATLCLAAQATTRLELDSYGAQGPDPYALGVPWVLKGTQAFTEADGSFSLSAPYAGNPNYVDSLHVSFLSNSGYTQGGRWIDLDFSTDKLGTPLDVGTYLGAQRFPFNDPGHPGLDLTDTGGGFNTLDGQFQIFDIKRDAQGIVTAFAASFEIFNYPAPTGSPLIGGRIWYNSDVSISSVPEPSTLVLLAIGVVGSIATSRRRANPA